MSQMRGDRLTSVEVLYYVPDYPSLLQSFWWQTLDLPPTFPRVCSFLNHWHREVHAVIHTVSVSAVGLISPINLNVARIVGRC